jgi:24-methylenesterol C-methyltransferase
MKMLCTPALQLEEVYGEVYRVLKPGALFVTYEWVTTKTFNPKDAQQQAVVDEIVIGNGLPVRKFRDFCYSSSDAGGSPLLP